MTSIQTLISAAYAQANFLRRLAKSDVSDCGNKSTIKEAEKWETMAREVEREVYGPIEHHDELAIGHPAV